MSDEDEGIPNSIVITWLICFTICFVIFVILYTGDPDLSDVIIEFIAAKGK
jgi:hypothetical protein